MLLAVATSALGEEGGQERLVGRNVERREREPVLDPAGGAHAADACLAAALPLADEPGVELRCAVRFDCLQELAAKELRGPVRIGERLFALRCERYATG